MNRRPEQAYVYRATVDRIVDGDTLDLSIDVGFRVATVQRVRLAGVDTPETRGRQRHAGIAVTESVHGWVEAYGPTFLVETGKQAGVFGRWIADVWAETGEHLNGWLLAERYAKPTTGSRVEWTDLELEEITKR